MKKSKSISVMKIFKHFKLMINAHF